MFIKVTIVYGDGTKQTSLVNLDHINKFEKSEKDGTFISWKNPIIGEDGTELVDYIDESAKEVGDTLAGIGLFKK